MMRFYFLCLLTILQLSSFSQTTAPEEHCIKWMITSSSRFNFHKPRTDCQFGFGLCLRLGRLEIRAVPCDEESSSNDLYDEDKVPFLAEFNGSQVIFHFPEWMTQMENLKSQDLSIFSIQNDELPIMDGHSEAVVTLRAGDYPVLRDNGELIVKVEAGFVRKTL
jgi:hypothetical protein